MAGSERNAREKDLNTLIRTEYSGYFLKSNKPYDKGAQLWNRTTGIMVESADTNYELLDKLTRPGYSLPVSEGLFNDSQVCNFKHVFKTELKKREDIINDVLLSIKEWTEGHRVIFRRLKGTHKVKILIDGKPICEVVK